VYKKEVDAIARLFNNRFTKQYYDYQETISRELHLCVITKNKKHH